MPIYAGGYRHIFGISTCLSQGIQPFFSLSFAQPPAVYNRVCKSSHSGRVKQSSRNRGLLSRSADFLYSIGGNPFGYLDPKPSRSSNPTPVEYSLTRIVFRESANARECILYYTFELPACFTVRFRIKGISMRRTGGGY